VIGSIVAGTAGNPKYGCVNEGSDAACSSSAVCHARCIMLGCTC
jgi:hypothetical protein